MQRLALGIHSGSIEHHARFIATERDYQRSASAWSRHGASTGAQRGHAIGRRQVQAAHGDAYRRLSRIGAATIVPDLELEAVRPAIACQRRIGAGAIRVQHNSALLYPSSE